MQHTLNIDIARSNPVSFSSSDAHLMGQVQVIMKIYVYNGFVSSIYTFPFFFFETRGLKAIHAFLSFSGGCSAVLQPLFMDFGSDGRVRG